MHPLVAALQPLDDQAIAHYCTTVLRSAARPHRDRELVAAFADVLRPGLCPDGGCTVCGLIGCGCR